MADRPEKFTGFEIGFRPVPALGEHDTKIAKEFDE